MEIKFFTPDGVEIFVCFKATNVGIAASLANAASLWQLSAHSRRRASPVSHRETDG